MRTSCHYAGCVRLEGFFPFVWHETTLPVLWTKSSSQSQQEDIMLKQKESLIDLYFAVAQLTDLSVS